MKHTKSHAGNAFFLILLGIILLAAFSIAVTRNSGTETGATSERDRIAATRILSYGSTLKNTVDQMRANGISESDLRFANNSVSGYGTVGANPSAEVFHRNGGGITYEKPDATWLDGIHTSQTRYGEWAFTGANSVRNVGTPASAECAAAECSELLAILRSIKKEICTLINRQLFGKSDIPVDSGTFADGGGFNGVFVYGDVISDASPFLLGGRQQGCFKSASSEDYHFYQVLIAR